MAKAGAKTKRATDGTKPKKIASAKAVRAKAGVKKTAKGGKPVARTAKKAVSGGTEAKEAARFSCEVCGLVVRVDEWGDINVVNLVCCGEQMGPVE